MSEKLFRRIFSGLVLLAAPFALTAQCAECTADPSCSSTDGMPTICPATLPAGTAAEFYEQNLTFYMPADIVDAGSGVTATLNSLTVTSISGLPLGLEVFLDEEDAIYEPAAGQNLGCATVCGTPLLPGAFVMTIHVSVQVTALGFDQTVIEQFDYALLIEPGTGGTTTFTYSPTAGCGTLDVGFDALIEAGDGQVANHAWDFGNGLTASGAHPDTVTYSEPGVYTPTLTTTIGQYELLALTLTGTNDGWSGDVDDLFTSPGDPYFVLTNANGVNVYTSSWAGNTTSHVWSGLNIPLTNPPYTVSFWDDDDITADDPLGSVAFNPEDNNAMYINASGTTATLNIALQPVQTIVDSASIEVFANPDPALENDGDSLYLPDGPWAVVNWYYEGEGVELSGPPEVSGWYQVDVTDTNGCFAVSAPALWCALADVLELELIWDAGTVEVPPGLGTYTWYADGVLLADETTNVAGAVEGALMSVEVSDHPDCPVLTASIDMAVAEFGKVAWRAFPTPFETALHITTSTAGGGISENSGMLVAELVDMQGRRIAQSPAFVGTLNWDGLNIPTGSYVLLLKRNETVLASQRVIRK